MVLSAVSYATYAKIAKKYKIKLSKKGKKKTMIQLSKEIKKHEIKNVKPKDRYFY